MQGVIKICSLSHCKSKGFRPDYFCMCDAEALGRLGGFFFSSVVLLHCLKGLVAVKKNCNQVIDVCGKESGSVMQSASQKVPCFLVCWVFCKGRVKGDW